MKTSWVRDCLEMVADNLLNSGLTSSVVLSLYRYLAA